MDCLSENDYAAYLAEDVSEPRKVKIREHLAMCATCRTELQERRQDLQFLVRVSPHMKAIDTDPGSTGASAPRWPKLDHASSGPMIEGYRIHEPIGRGGMGIVYRATQINLNRVVALKVLPHVSPSTDNAIARRFQREATAAARLQHRNIVPVYDFGESGGHYFYTMELIHGWSLDKVIEFFQPYRPEPSARALSELVSALSDVGAPSAQTPAKDLELSGSDVRQSKAYYRIIARWIADAAAALGHAHDLGVVHRDVKPSNIILTAEGHVKMVDFGLAKAGGETITQTGSLLGTLSYMSPEQAMAKRIPVDHRTDVYSLGATMYELLTLRPAFTGDNRSEILGQIVTSEPERPRKVASGVPRELDTICLKAMEKAPGRRYETARAMEDDLKRYLNDLPIIARPPSSALRIAKFVRRHRFASAVAIAMLVTAWAMSLFIENLDLKAWARKQGLKFYGTNQVEVSFLVDDRHLENLYGLIEENKLDNALGYAKSITSGEPGASNPYYIAARGFILLLRAEKHPKKTLLERAIADYEECAKLDSDFEAISHEGRGNAYHLRARFFDHDQDYQLAISHYSRALGIQPDFPRARSNRAHAYFDTRRYAEALADYEIAVAAGFDTLRACVHDFERTYYNYGTALRILGEPARAAAQYRLAVQARPQDAYSDVALALAYFDLGRFREGDRRLQTAIEKASPKEWIGKVARCLSGDLAPDDLIAASQDVGEKCEAYYYGGEASFRAGHVDRAIGAFERCLSTGKSGFNEYRFAEWRLSGLR